MQRTTYHKNQGILGTCVCLILLLVLGSFSNVVGYQSVKSTSLDDSPLFDVRTKKATENNNPVIISSNYLGSRSHFLQFPLRENRADQIQKAFAIIQMMDEKEFYGLQNRILSILSDQHNTIDVEKDQLVAFLRQIKSNTKEIKIILSDIGNDTRITPPTTVTMVDACCVTILSTFRCTLFWILFFLLSPLIFLLDILMSVIH